MSPITPPLSLPVEQRAFQARILTADPFIAIGCTTPATPLGAAPYVAERVGERDALWLVVLHWTLETGDLRDRIAACWRAFAPSFPRHRVLMLCNTPRELALLEEAGVPAMLCNHNVLVSERLYDVRAGEAKLYDAVYNARMLRYKRHALARAIARLAVIYYDVESAEEGYFAEVRAALPHAVFVNEAMAKAGYGRLANARAQALAAELIAARSYVGLRPETVAETLNRAQVGLCLSAAEGAMYASMEYLLCGLPVVSTASLGGRDAFFAPEYSRIVPAEPQAIADAAAALARAAPPAGEIRARTLARVLPMRAALRARVAVIGGERAGVDAAWERLFAGRWWQWTTIDDFCAAFATAG